MKHRNAVGLIAVIVLALVLIFSGCVEERAGEPDRIGEFSLIQKEDGSLQMQLGLLDKNFAPIASSGHVEIVIKDKLDNVVYRNEFEVDATDFQTYERVLTGAKFLGYLYVIPSNKIEKGFSDSGTAYLKFTSNGKILSATGDYVSIPKFSDEEIQAFFEDQYSKSAITVGNTLRNGNFEVTLVRFGYFTHLEYDTWGDQVTEFRVDVKVKNIGSEKDSLYSFNAVILDDLGGQSEATYDSKFDGSGIHPGVTKEGYLLFEGINKNAKTLRLVWEDGYVWEGLTMKTITFEFTMDVTKLGGR